MKPYKLNDELIDKIAEEVKDGMPLQFACNLYYITQETFNTWMRQGEIDVRNEMESLQAKLFLIIKQAYAIYIKEAKKKIRKGESGWQGEAWWLERTNQQTFVINNDSSDNVEPVIVKTGVKSNYKCYSTQKN